MEETELEMLSLEQRTELEGHLYSLVYHNSNTYEENVNSEQFPSSDALKLPKEESVLLLKSNIDQIDMPACKKRKLSIEDTVISIVSSDSDDDDDVVEICQPPILITIESDDENIDQTSVLKHSCNSENQVSNFNLKVKDISDLKPNEFNTISVGDDFLKNDCSFLYSTEVANNTFNGISDSKPSTFNTNSTGVDDFLKSDCDFLNSTEVASDLSDHNRYSVQKFISPGERLIIENDSSSENSEFQNLDISIHSESNVISKNLEKNKPSKSKTKSKEHQIELNVSGCSTFDNFLSPRPKRAAKPKIRSFNRKELNMHDFYTMSWGGEHFDHDIIISKMPSDREKWRVSNLEARGNRRCKWQKIRCRNCHHMGHPLVLCPEPKRIIRCHMCGLEGHAEPRCPNKICLKCGMATSSFVVGCNNCRITDRMICSVCNMVGHIKDRCPDLWRRYHRSIDPTRLPISQIDNLKHPRNLYCSNCSMQGHIYHNCNKLRMDQHSLYLPNIIDYNAVLPLEKPNHNKSNNTISNETFFDTSSKLHDKTNDQAFLNNLNDFETVFSDDSSEVTNSLMDISESDMYNSVGISDKSNFKTDQNTEDKTKDNLCDTSHNDNVSIILDKQTMAMLMKSEGSKFLENVAKTLNLKIELKFTITGGSLVLKGSEAQYISFQESLKDWIKSVNSKLLIAACNCTLPRKSKPLLNFINSVKTSIKSTIKNPHGPYQNLRKIKKLNAFCILTSNQVKLYNKNLRKLNIILFGQNGFRDGKMHMEKLNTLTRELSAISDSNEITPHKLYEEIKSHYEYIFSSVDHGNYEELLKLHKIQKISNRNKNIANSSTQNFSFYKAKCRNDITLQNASTHLKYKH